MIGEGDTNSAPRPAVHPRAERKMASLVFRMKLDRFLF